MTLGSDNSQHPNIGLPFERRDLEKKRLDTYDPKRDIQYRASVGNDMSNLSTQIQASVPVDSKVDVLYGLTISSV